MRTGLFVTVSVLLLAAQGGDNPGDYVMQDGQVCSITGKTTSLAIKSQNRLKNRFVAPGEDEIDPQVTLAAMVAPGDDHTRFSSTRGATIVGFVIDVIIPEQGETCNCKATDQTDADTHIELAMVPGAPGNHRVIVEVTPRLRKQMKDKGIDWSSKTLQSPTDGIVNKWVEVTGWLFFDTIHADGAENTNPGGDGNWRATCWEIHPITSMKVLAGPPADLPAFDSQALTHLQVAHAKRVDRHPLGRQEVNNRIAADINRFGEEARTEHEEERQQRMRRMKPNP